METALSEGGTNLTWLMTIVKPVTLLVTLILDNPLSRAYPHSSHLLQNSFPDWKEISTSRVIGGLDLTF